VLRGWRVRGKKGFFFAERVEKLQAPSSNIQRSSNQRGDRLLPQRHRGHREGGKELVFSLLLLVLKRP
jgi:hypothetical protein